MEGPLGLQPGRRALSVRAALSASSLPTRAQGTSPWGTPTACARVHPPAPPSAHGALTGKGGLHGGGGLDREGELRCSFFDWGGRDPLGWFSFLTGKDGLCCGVVLTGKERLCCSFFY